MRIAVWNTAFLGDAVLTLPLIHALHAAFPDASIDMYVRRGLGSLFAAQPELATVYEIAAADRSVVGMLGLFRRVAAQGYDLWIGAHQSIRSSMLARASGAAVRIGYSGAWHRTLAYTSCVPRRFGELDEVERLLELLRPLAPLIEPRAAVWPPVFCIDPPADRAEKLVANELVHELANDTDHLAVSKRANDTEHVAENDREHLAVNGRTNKLSPKKSVPRAAQACVWPNLVLPDAVRANAAAFRAALPPGPVLGLHPGSVWATKRWMPEGFAFVARQAVEAGAVLVLFAGAGEVATVDHVLKQAALDASHPRVCNLAGRLSLPELAANLAVLDCYLTNDSGPMHLAWMQHTPLVALFGPTVRELGFFPRGAQSVVLEARACTNHDADAGLACRPCGLHGPQLCPRGDHACMRAIAPERVWEAVRARLWS